MHHNTPKTVLVTGFESFGGDEINPSAEAANALHGSTVSGYEIVSVTLPCVFGRSFDELARLVEELRPQLVLCVGQASGRAAINLERVALNVDDAPMPDNSGARPVDRVIAKEGPVAYWSTLPLTTIASALAASGIEAVISQSAGTFVCNHVFYRLMQHLEGRRDVLGGFVHVPLLPEQAKRGPSAPQPPSMPLETITQALRIAIRISLSGDAELR